MVRQKDFNIVVLCGAKSPEHDVSVNSGTACAEALRESFPRVSLRVLEENALPADLSPERDVIMPAIHGDYGEDGGVQRDLEARGFAYAGCGIAASELCIDKAETKKILHGAGVPVPDGIAFFADARPSASELISRLGNEEVVVKPADKGSSVGLFLTAGKDALASVLAGDLSAAKKWIAEPRLRGRELTVGLLDGKAAGIVEIRPKIGVYDFKNKYTKGSTEYIFPAEIENATAEAIRANAEKIFAACGCRDFARADVILLPSGEFYFLEVNTMPGMTSTSLLPKSASCVGLDFPALVKAMLEPAIKRFFAK